MTEPASQPIVAPVGILNGAPGIAAFSAPPTVVYKPSQSDTRDVNSYQSLAGACATLKSVGSATGMSGNRTLGFSDPSGALTVPAGTYDPGLSCEWVGDTSEFQLSFATGATIAAPSKISGILLQNNPGGAPAVVIDLAGGYYEGEWRNAGLLTMDGVTPILSIVDSVGGGSFQLTLWGDSFFDVNTIAIATGASITGFVYLNDSARSSNFASGDAGSVVMQVNSPAAAIVTNDPVVVNEVVCIPAELLLAPGTIETALNVCGSEASLAGALGGTFGPITIWYDFSGVGNAYTSTQTNFAAGSTMAGLISPAFGVIPSYTIDGSVTTQWLTPPTYIENLFLNFAHSAAWSSAPAFLKLSGFSAIASDGAGPVADFTAAESTILLTDETSLDSASLFQVESGATLIVNLLDVSAIPGPNVFTIVAGGAVNITLWSPGASVHPSYWSQAGVTVAYAPGVVPSAYVETVFPSSAYGSMLDLYQYVNALAGAPARIVTIGSQAGPGTDPGPSSGPIEYYSPGGTSDQTPTDIDLDNSISFLVASNLSLPVSIDGTSFLNEVVGGSPFSITVPNADELLCSVRNCSLRNDAAGPLFPITTSNPANTGAVIFDLDNVALSGTAPFPLITLTGAPLIQVVLHCSRGTRITYDLGLGANLTLHYDATCTIAAQAGATLNPTGLAVQSGRTTLTAGVSPAISANITASSRIEALHANANASTAFGFLFALDSDRVVGGVGTGSFKIRAFTSPGTATTGDLSDVDWTVTG